MSTIVINPYLGGANWWEAGGATGAVAVYQPKGAANLAESYTDLSGNGNDAAAVVAPTWDAVNGWVFNGTTQWLDSGITPGTLYTFFVGFSGALPGTSNAYLFGNGGGVVGIDPNNTTFSQVLWRFNSAVRTSPVMVAGILAMNADGGYRDGVFDSPISAGTPTTVNTIAIGRANGGGLRAANIQTFAIYDNKLTAPQVAAVSAAMAAL